MCADRDSCFALDAPGGRDGDPSSFYRITGNQRPPGGRRAVRNAQVDPGPELDLGSTTDNMTRVVVSSSDTPVPVPGPRPRSREVAGTNLSGLHVCLLWCISGSLFIHCNRPQ